MELKQVIVIRKDLKMGVGKLAVQVAHASILAYERSKSRNTLWFKTWYQSGQPKIVLKANSLEEIEEIEEKARVSNLPVVIVRDAGLTQLEPGTATCVGVGPAPSNMIDSITGGFKLL
jgi:PTH2 family peptidyl-tRNA hydrolase